MFDFNETHYKFLETEFGACKDAIAKMNTDELGDLYEEVCEIEIDETCKAGDGKLSQRGETAVQIVNIMADSLGYNPIKDCPKCGKDGYDEAYDNCFYCGPD